MSTSDSDWLASDEEEDNSVGRALSPPPESRDHHEAHDFSHQHTSEGTCLEEGSSGCDTPSSHVDSFQAHDPLPPPPQERHRTPSPRCPGKTSGSQPRPARKRPCGGDGLEPGCHQPTDGTERDELFADKCRDLQCFVRPLSSILNSLRSGRYRQRLSTFQESIAIDRLQRIMGILQNPGMGERYINILLKVEELLKTWFPNIKPGNEAFDEQTKETCLPKKQKLAPATTPITVPAANLACPTPSIPEAAMTWPCSATSLKWLHTSPICSPCTLGAELHGRLPPRDKDTTQDNAVSSSSDSNPRTRPPQGKINAPCLERLLKCTESIIVSKDAGGPKGGAC